MTLLLRLPMALVELEIPDTSHWTVGGVVRRLEAEGFYVRVVEDMIVLDGTKSSSRKELP